MSGQPVERLRDYLRELKPGSRALLIGELERGLLRGEEMPGGSLVLEELRRTVRESGQTTPRASLLARLFFRPLEPFLVDDIVDHKHCGRIARAALEPMWTWISRDLVPGEAEQAAADVAAAMAANDLDGANAHARTFQDQVIPRIEAAIAAAQDDRVLRRLNAQIGTPRALEDAKAVLGILKSRDRLDDIGGRLPGHIADFSGGTLSRVSALLQSPLCDKPEILLHALVLVMSRLGARWQLIRLGIGAARSDLASEVAATPYGVTVAIAFGEAERMVNELRADLQIGRGVALSGLLRDIHDSVRGLRTELDLPPDSPWARRLARLRADISDLLKEEIKSVPGRVRQLLRPRAAADIAPDAVLDAADIGATENLIQFVAACRQYASELAIIEVTQRTHAELQQSLDFCTPPVIEALRNMPPAESAFRRSQADAAIRFGATMYGADHGAALARTAAKAAGTVPSRGDPKANRA